MHPSGDIGSLSAGNADSVVVQTRLFLGFCLERVPIKWNHLIDKDSLKIKELEHALMRHRIYPMSKYRKSRATFSGHALG
jgi:hypothetical protein